jgi:hypothetical protein
MHKAAGYTGLDYDQQLTEILSALSYASFASSHLEYSEQKSDK